MKGIHHFFKTYLGDVPGILLEFSLVKVLRSSLTRTALGRALPSSVGRRAKRSSADSTVQGGHSGFDAEKESRKALATRVILPKEPLQKGLYPNKYP